MIAYLNNQFMAKEDITISPDDRGFLFADGLYEVMMCYSGTLFRAEEHIARLNYGATHLRFARTDFSSLIEVAKKLIEKNGLTECDATVYFQVTRGTAKRSHSFPGEETPLTVYAFAAPFNNSGIMQAKKQGGSAITIADQRWARCDLKTVGLTANILANQQAHEEGATEALFVRDGVLLEGSHSNFMAVFDDVLVTAPVSNYILGGITRMTILEIAAELGITTELRPIYAKDLPLATEAMIVGTTVEVIPITAIDKSMVGTGIPGPVTRRLQQGFTDRVAISL